MHDTNTPIGETPALAEGTAPPNVAPDVAPLGIAPRPRLYLRIAITGHRHAARLNEGAVRRGLARAFDACADVVRVEHETDADVRSSDRAELVLLSALAEGADQIAVDVFAARQEPDWMQSRIEAVIPFDIEGYASTMDDAAARGRMREMAKAASACMVMADGSPDAGRPDDPHEAHWRDHRYAMAGDILVRQADVLIAAWDGVPSTAMGGAAWVLANALREGVPVLWVHAQDGRVRLLTPHSPHGELLGAVARPGGSLDLESSEAVAGLRERLAPLLAPAFDGDDVEEHDFDAYARSRRSYRSFFGNGGGARKPKLRTWATAYSRLLWFTGSYVEHETTAGEPAHPARTVAHRAWPASKWPGWRIDCAQTPMPARSEYLKDWSSDRLRESIALPWITFDTMATRLGHIYRSSYVVTFLFAALAVLIALGGQFVPVEYETYMSLLELGALFVAGSSFLLSRFFRVHDRWVIARDIEGRLRAAWNVAQLGFGGRRAPRRASAPWPAWAVQAWAGDVGLPRVETTRDHLAALAAYLRKTAVADQVAYHRSNARRLHMLHHTLEWAGKIAFFAAFCVCIAAFAHHYRLGPDIGSRWNLFIGAGMPAVAAALAGLRYQGDFLRFATRSARTAHDLGAVEAELTKFIARMEDAAVPDKEKRDGFAELCDIVLSLEAVLIADLQDWRYVYAARPNPEP